MPLPGGLQGALAAIDDRLTPDRSHFLLEFIRRTYNTPPGAAPAEHMAALQSLLGYLDRADDAHTAAPEMLPLPLPAAIWVDVVFGGRAQPENLLSAILRSRNASLLYYGLLSLDEETRAWLATEPALIADLTSRHAAAFVTAAPGLRATAAAVRVPGGESAAPAWQALVGRPVTAPADFLRALLAHSDGRLAYFFGTMAQLHPLQIRFALALDSPSADARIERARRLFAVFDRLASGWSLENRTFWRPALDPGLLVSDLQVDEEGRPVLPGTDQFWSLVFAVSGRRQDDTPRALAGGEPVDFAWLCEQVFKGDQAARRTRYRRVLFASRVLRVITPETAHDAFDAVRAVSSYPALVTALERTGLHDVRIYAGAVRRAAQLSAIRDRTRAHRALAQFQGTLAVATRAAARGNVPPEALAHLVSSLSAVDPGERGDYDGGLVRWFERYLRGVPGVSANGEPALLGPDENGAGVPGDNLEGNLLHLLAGRAAVEQRFVEWEGTRYRVDLAEAETIRLARLMGEDSPSYLSSAGALVAIADRLGGTALTPEALRQDLDALQRVAEAVALEHEGEWEGTDVPQRYRRLAQVLQRAAREGRIHDASRQAPALRLLADDLLAQGLLEFVYATALGHPGTRRRALSAPEAARRHDFGLRGSDAHSGPWRLPWANSEPVRGWRVTGSLLGLDVRLADFSLMRMSFMPPSRKPTLNSEERRVLIEAVALVQPAALNETNRNRIVEAMRKGRERLSALRTETEAVALADEIRLGPARRTLLSWVVAREPERLAAFLSPAELLWLGLDRMPIDAGLHAWGAPAEPRLGCLCLELVDRRPWEALAGRWYSGVFASGFPDLNLRLTELLAELQMPASLLGPVLASATLDFVDNVDSRDPDDRRGLVDFVQALSVHRVEEYLALLTADGPLVPIDDAVEPPAHATGTGSAR